MAQTFFCQTTKKICRGFVVENEESRLVRCFRGRSSSCVRQPKMRRVVNFGMLYATPSTEFVLKLKNINFRSIPGVPFQKTLWSSQLMLPKLSNLLSESMSREPSLHSRSTPDTAADIDLAISFANSHQGYTSDALAQSQADKPCCVARSRIGNALAELHEARIQHVISKQDILRSCERNVKN